MRSGIISVQNGFECENMKPSDPASLQNLNDIVMPATTGWWPLASGWNVLAGLVLIFLCWFVYKSVRDWKANRYRRSALSELEVLSVGIQNPAGRSSSLRKIPALLKRTALAAYPRNEVAMLTGEDWFRFLNSTVKKPSFTENTFDTLNHIAYTTGDLHDINGATANALVDACRQWLKHHLALAGSKHSGES
jgi:hypothetical protein